MKPKKLMKKKYRDPFEEIQDLLGTNDIDVAVKKMTERKAHILKRMAEDAEDRRRREEQELERKKDKNKLEFIKRFQAMPPQMRQLIVDSLIWAQHVDSLNGENDFDENGDYVESEYEAPAFIDLTNEAASGPYIKVNLYDGIKPQDIFDAHSERCIEEGIISTDSK